MTTPAGVIRPIRAALNSVNQRLPSAPLTMLVGAESAVGTWNSFTAAAPADRASAARATSTTSSPASVFQERDRGIRMIPSSSPDLQLRAFSL